MSKDFPKTGEGGHAAPAEQPEKVGPVAGHVGTPLDHAKAIGQVKVDVLNVARVNGAPEKFDVYSPQHMAAAALHGWDEHAHHEAKPIQLSADDYKAALHAAFNPVTRVVGKDGKPGAEIDSHEAAAKGIPTITDYEPHVAALSPHKGKG